MKKIKLFIASSLDGKIARPNGSLDWLNEFPASENNDYGYSDFLAGIDSILMGRKTYEDIINMEGDWPYASFKTYVLTKQKDFAISTQNTELIHSLNKKIVKQIKTKQQKDSWIVGGGGLITILLNMSMIDEMIISLVPLILGQGISLFPAEPLETRFQLISSNSFESGIVNLHYARKDR